MRKFVVLCAVLAGVMPAGLAYAAVHTTAGYAWSGDDLGTGILQGGIGWVSMSCDNGATCGAVNYGVDVNAIGQLSGYAWSGDDCNDALPATVCGVGWISFNAAEVQDFGLFPVCGYPTCPGQVAKFNLVTGVLEGWARIYPISIGSPGGWDGYIKFSGTAQNAAPYGWSRPLVGPSCAVSGYAWGGGTNGPGTEVIGWLHANGASYGVQLTGAACGPVVTALAASPDMCNIDPQIVVSWTYSDPNPQTNYEVRVADDLAMTLNVRDSTVAGVDLAGSATTCNVTFPGAIICKSAGGPDRTPDFAYSTQYYWQVRAKNSLGQWSPWTSPVQVLFPPPGGPPTHAHPQVTSLTVSPTAAFVGQPVSFNSTATAAPPYSIASYVWSFTSPPGGPPYTAYTCVIPAAPALCQQTQNPVISFNQPGSLEAKVTVTDNAVPPYDCGKAVSPFIIGAQLPKWKEVTPK